MNELSSHIIWGLAHYLSSSQFGVHDAAVMGEGMGWTGLEWCSQTRLGSVARVLRSLVYVRFGRTRLANKCIMKEYLNTALSDI
jgi:hypothetical protein